jgi:hypothetical protein
LYYLAWVGWFIRSCLRIEYIEIEPEPEVLKVFIQSFSYNESDSIRTNSAEAIKNYIALK